MQTPHVVKSAEAKISDEKGGFPAQEQAPPGLTQVMEPVPDHGEDTWEGNGRLEGLKAFITGGDSGIGRAVAIAYAREGADVAIGYLEVEQEDAEATKQLIEDAGRTAVLVPCELTSGEACETAVDDAVSGLGGLDILVNNAGYHWARGKEGIEGLEPDHVDRVLWVNFAAVIWVTKAAVPHLKKGSAIINTTSIQAYDPSVPIMDYAATKAAVNNLTVSLANDLGSKGIRVNAVAPGPIWTPLQPGTRKGETVRDFGADTPLGRPGQPAELAGAYVFLASPKEASYVSGTVVGVTGGKPVF